MNTELAFAYGASALALLVAIAAMLAAVRHSSARRIRSCESKLATLSSDMDELGSLLKAMDARDRMRAVRARQEPRSESSPTPTDVPNPYTNPAEWKRHMRARGIPIARKE
jgi:hypothetical protein